MGKEFPDPEDWISVRREAPRRQVVLMMDTSLSMSGRNLALAAVAAAVLAFKVKSEDLAVVAFENQARTLTRLYDSVSADVIVEAILSQPAQGSLMVALASPQVLGDRAVECQGRSILKVAALLDQKFPSRIEEKDMHAPVLQTLGVNDGAHFPADELIVLIDHIQQFIGH
jgi:uncharacterized protein (DUF58 family)